MIFLLLSGITQEQQIIISMLCLSTLLLTIFNGIFLCLIHRKNKKLKKEQKAQLCENAKNDSEIVKSDDEHNM